VIGKIKLVITEATRSLEAQSGTYM